MLAEKKEEEEKLRLEQEKLLQAQKEKEEAELLAKKQKEEEIKLLAKRKKLTIENNTKLLAEKRVERFKLPVVLSLLARIGVVNSTFLKERRKYVVVMIFAAAAVLTPPDPVTQIGLAIPLLILYELSIFSVNIIEKKAAQKNA